MSGRTFPVGDRPRLEVELRTGRLDVAVGGPGAIEVTVARRGAEESLEVFGIGDVVTVRNRSGWLQRGGSGRVAATVPPGTEIRVSAASADLDLAGSLGDVTVDTASGDVSAIGVGSLEVKTASGDVEVEEVQGDLELRTASGDVRAGSVAGRLAGSLASGDLRVDRVGGDVRLSTASGDVRIDRCDGREVAVKTLSGRVLVGIPSGTRVEADITTLSGRVRLPEPEPGLEGASPDRRMRLMVHSVSGDVEIRRA